MSKEYYNDNWKFTNWGPYGLWETFFKVIGWIGGFGSFIVSFDHGAATTVATAIILFISTFCLILAVPDRLKLKDIGSMIFLMINILCHLLVAISMLRDVPVYWIIIFLAAFMIGDIIKLFWIRGNPEEQISSKDKKVFYVLVGLFVVFYFVSLLIVLFTL